MQYFRRVLISLLVKLLDERVTPYADYKQIKPKAMKTWLWENFSNVGWRSYFAHQDLMILRSMSFAQSQDKYMQLVGRRLQLLYIFEAMKREDENRKSNMEKVKDSLKRNREIRKAKMRKGGGTRI